MKAGAFYWKAVFDEEGGKVEVDEYGCRSVRKGRAYLTLKESWTWGKRSKKNGDFGWLDPVPAWCRNRVLEGSPGADMFRPTKRGALMAALAAERRTRARYKDAETRACCDLAIAALSARLKRAGK